MLSVIRNDEEIRAGADIGLFTEPSKVISLVFKERGYGPLGELFGKGTTDSGIPQAFGG